MHLQKIVSDFYSWENKITPLNVNDLNGFIMKESYNNKYINKGRELPPHAYHPNASLLHRRHGYIARP